MPVAAEYHDLRRRGLCTQSCGRPAAGSKCRDCKAKERARERKRAKRLKRRVQALEDRNEKIERAMLRTSERLLELELLEAEAWLPRHERTDG